VPDDQLTVYIVVEVGLALTVAPDVVLRPVDGVQVYVPPVPPLATKLTAAPVEHLVALLGVTIIEVVGVTVTNLVTITVHIPLVQVAVYVVVAVGVAITVAPVVTFNELAGPQV
jgi:hypothetical protein